MTLEPFLVTTLPTLDDLRLFGIKVSHYHREPRFERSHGTWWKHAAWEFMYDDGRFHVMIQDHCSERDERIVAGAIEIAYRGGVKYARANGYRRVRRSKKEPVAFYEKGLYIKAARDDKDLQQLEAALYGPADRFSKAPTDIEIRSC